MTCAGTGFYWRLILLRRTSRIYGKQSSVEGDHAKRKQIENSEEIFRLMSKFICSSPNRSSNRQLQTFLKGIFCFPSYQLALSLFQELKRGLHLTSLTAHTLIRFRGQGGTLLPLVSVVGRTWRKSIGGGGGRVHHVSFSAVLPRKQQA